MRLLDSLLGHFRARLPLKQAPSLPHQDDTALVSVTSRDVDLIAAMGARIVEGVNESMQIAGQSRNVETRRSRVRIAREKIEQLQELAAEFPFVRIQRLDDVERDLTKIDRESDAMAQAPCEHWKLGNPAARHPYAFEADHPSAGMFDGLEFHATFQLRTPKRILERNGIVIPLTVTPPSDFEPWMGVWLPKLSNSIFASAPQRVASEAGQVDPSAYLPFLLAVREIIEDGAATIAERIERIEAVCLKPEWLHYVAASRGAAGIYDRFFPPALSLIRGLSSVARKGLEQMDVRTVGGLRDMQDDRLLAIKGIGRAKLAAIRASCAEFSDDPRAERIVSLAS